jgi:2,3-dihydroxybenzoate-AMP ligase
MLDGVTPFPAEFAARYRDLGYWEDRPLFEGFTGALAKYADRVALVDDGGPVTYRQLDERSARLARVLLDEGFGPLDRIRKRSSPTSPRPGSRRFSSPSISSR